MSLRLNPTLAVQWFHNGDFPGENPNQEGTVVRYFRHPNYSGSDCCPKCSKIYHDHGFLDRSGNPAVVCPGDVLFTFDPEKGRMLETLGVISSDAYSSIFGAQGLLKAQQANRSFCEGDTDEEILKRKEIR